MLVQTESGEVGRTERREDYTQQTTLPELRGGRATWGQLADEIESKPMVSALPDFLHLLPAEWWSVSNIQWLFVFVLVSCVKWFAHFIQWHLKAGDVIPVVWRRPPLVALVVGVYIKMYYPYPSIYFFNPSTPPTFLIRCFSCLPKLQFKKSCGHRRPKCILIQTIIYPLVA